MSYLSTRLHDISKRLSQSLERLGRAPKPGEKRLDTAFEAIENYERLSSEVYRLRSLTGPANSPAVVAARRSAEDLLVSSAHDLVGFTRGPSDSRSAYQMFIQEYRLVWRKHFGLFFFTACLFAALMVVGWNVGVNQPDYLALLLSQELMEQIHDNQAWFARLNENPLRGGFEIALNNIKVATGGFLLGAVFGIGALYVLGFNAFMFGGVLGYCRTHRFDEPLWNFVASHGPLEITIIIASCFAGLLMGRVFYLRPRSLFTQRMKEAAREAGILAIGIIPWLIVAAIFEALISPRVDVAVSWKLTSGIVIAFCFWLWTFAPLAKKT